MAMGIVACGNSETFPRTELFEGITEGDYDRGQRLLRQRIESRFKVGDSEEGLEAFLRSQGLNTRRNETSEAPGTPIYGEAVATHEGPCDQIVRVNWRADHQRIIRELVVSYSSEGCL